MLSGFWVVAEGDGRTKYIDDFYTECKSLVGWARGERIVISRHDSPAAAERQRDDLIEWMKSGLVFAKTDDISGVTTYAPYVYDVRIRKVKEAQGGSNNEQ
jgi:hypothetical protein